MRVLVTGGAGFIGSHVVEVSLAAGHEVAVLDNLSSGKRENVPGGVPLFEVDLRDRAATAGVVADFRPDVVSHQAAQASVSVSVRDPGLDADVNVKGAIHLLDACAERGVQRVVFASTGGAIYGEVPGDSRASEATPPQPLSPYAIHKLAVEHLLRFYKLERGVDYRILRYANIYGPRQDAHGEAGVVAIFLERALTGQPVRVNARREAGDPGCIRDYTYVSDVARANLLALSGELDFDVLNVGSGHATTTQELAEKVVAAVGANVAIEHGPKRAGDLERSVLDPTRCQSVVGTPTVLAAGLGETANWYRELPR